MNSAVVGTTSVRKGMEIELVKIKSASDLPGQIWCYFPISDKCCKIKLIKKSVPGIALQSVKRSNK